MKPKNLVQSKKREGINILHLCFTFAEIILTIDVNVKRLGLMNRSSKIFNRFLSINQLSVTQPRILILFLYRLNKNKIEVIELKYH